MLKKTIFAIIAVLSIVAVMAKEITTRKASVKETAAVSNTAGFVHVGQPAAPAAKQLPPIRTDFGEAEKTDFRIAPETLSVSEEAGEPDSGMPAMSPQWKTADADAEIPYWKYDIDSPKIWFIDVARSKNYIVRLDLITNVTDTIGYCANAGTWAVIHNDTLSCGQHTKVMWQGRVIDNYSRHIYKVSESFKGIANGGYDAKFTPISVAFNSRGIAYGCFQDVINGRGFIAKCPDWNYSGGMKFSEIKELSVPIDAMGFDHADMLYGFDRLGKIVKIDTATGDVESVAQTTLIPNTDMVSVKGTFDRNREIMYVYCLNSKDSTESKPKLYEIPLKTMIPVEKESPRSLYWKIFHIPYETYVEFPGKPQNVRIANYDTETVTVTFEAPNKTYGGDALTGALGYEIIGNGKVLKSGETRAGEEVNAEFSIPAGKYDFQIYCSNDLGKGAEYTEEKFIGAFDTPYSEKLQDQERFTPNFKIVNRTGSGEYGWLFQPIPDYMTFHRAPADGKCDNWLITPSIKLESSKIYKLRFVVPRVRYSATYEHKFEIKIGSAANPDSMTGTIVPPTTFIVGGENETTIEEYFHVDNSGNYNISVHTLGSSEGETTFYLDELSISAPMSGDGPAKVQDLAVDAYSPVGEKKATINFKSPEDNLLGQKLAALTKIEVLRDSTVVKTLDSPVPGSVQKVELEVPADGNYTFSVIPYNSYGAGPTSFVKSYVGMPKPSIINNFTLGEVDANGNMLISWDHALTAEGDSISPEVLTYTIENMIDRSEKIEDIKDNKYIYSTGLKPGEQKFIAFRIYAKTTRGISQSWSTNTQPVGIAYEFPFRESFANGSLSHIMAVEHPSEGGWILSTDQSLSDMKSSDNDNGYVGMYSESPNGLYGSLSSGRISLKDAKNPVLSFKTYNLYSANAPVNGNTIRVKVRNLPGSFSEIAEGSIYNFITSPKEDWQKVEIDVSRFKGNDVQFEISCLNKTFIYTFFDDFQISERPECDVAVKEFNVPTEASNGEKFKIRLSLENKGVKDAGNFDAVLYRNGKEIQRRHIERLDSAATTTVEFEESVFSSDNKFVDYQAAVEYDKSLALSDCKSETCGVYVWTDDPTGMGVLTGKEEGNAVNLEWTAPEAIAESQYTEGFEDMQGFDYYNIRGWTTVNGSNLASQGISGLLLPNFQAAVTKTSFWVTDVEDLGDHRLAFKPKKGYKAVTSIGAFQPSVSDDWLISPELSGLEQTVRLFARSYDESYKESIELLYSVCDTDTANFVVAETYRQLPMEWTEYSFKVPAGAKYFAIRCISDDKFILLVDEITYQPLGYGGSARSVKGYNIYRDGELINAALVSGTAYRDENVADGNHEYCVTAVYDNAESRPSNRVTVQLSGIENAALTEVNVKGGNGVIVVAGADGRKVNVADAAGMTLYAGTPSDNLRVKAAPGVYVVKVSGKSYKVMVK